MNISKHFNNNQIDTSMQLVKISKVIKRKSKKPVKLCILRSKKPVNLFKSKLLIT